MDRTVLTLALDGEMAGQVDWDNQGDDIDRNMKNICIVIDGLNAFENSGRLSTFCI